MVHVGGQTMNSIYIYIYFFFFFFLQIVNKTKIIVLHENTKSYK